MTLLETVVLVAVVVAYVLLEPRRRGRARWSDTLDDQDPPN